MPRYHVYTEAVYPDLDAAPGRDLAFYVDQTAVTLATLYAEEAGGATLDNPYTTPPTALVDFWTEDLSLWVRAEGDPVVRPLNIDSGYLWAFDDTEGDPAPIGTVAEGASTHSARRDHVHAGDHVSLANKGANTHAQLDTFISNLDVVNVKDYGAKGDGSTDDTAAIQAAVSHFDSHPPYYGTIYVPPGTYVITNVILRDGISLIGAGTLATVFRTKGISGAALQWTGTGTSVSYFEVRNLSVGPYDAAESVDYGIRFGPATGGGGTGGPGSIRMSGVRSEGWHKISAIGCEVAEASWLSVELSVFQGGSGGRGFKCSAVALNSGLSVFSTCSFLGSDIGMELVGTGLLDSVQFNACYFSGASYPEYIKGGVRGVCHIACHYEVVGNTLDAIVGIEGVADNLSWDGCIFSGYGGTATPYVLLFKTNRAFNGIRLDNSMVDAGNDVWTPTIVGTAASGATFSACYCGNITHNPATTYVFGDSGDHTVGWFRLGGGYFDPVGYLRVSGSSWIISESGSPEGVAACTVGSLYLRTDSTGDNAPVLYVKTFGAGTSGWAVVTTTAV